MSALAEAVAGFISTLIEVTLEAFRNLIAAVCALSSKRHRERLQKEWRSGWQAKFTLSLSIGFGAFVITGALYLWVRILV